MVGIAGSLDGDDNFHLINTLVGLVASIDMFVGGFPGTVYLERKRCKVGKGNLELFQLKLIKWFLGKS